MMTGKSRKDKHKLDDQTCFKLSPSNFLIAIMEKISETITQRQTTSFSESLPKKLICIIMITAKSRNN
jgi:hypothetical protein